MKQMKNYQESAVSQLVTASKMYFDTDENETIVLQAPTGSGKTFMMSNYISQIILETNLDLCFLWVSVGSGNLHVQSYKSVKNTVTPAVECNLLENEYLGSKSEISRNEIVFVNWEKIRAKDSKTGAFKNSVMKDQDGINFIEVLENTRNHDKKIILIIDESHASANTTRARELRDGIIKPFLTIEMSATPVLTNDMMMKVQVDPTKVIEEGMIKKEIIVNKDLKDEEVKGEEQYSEDLILRASFERREELKKLYIKNGASVNPLVLIQLPNGEAGEIKKNTVLKFLESKGNTLENGKVAIWLNEEKLNLEEEALTKNDSPVDFLLFKQAVDTGWDCPRAQILVKFRETTSIVFEIQTVGRILRMPETKHYDDEELNTAYVYSNIGNIEIKKETYNPNIIKSLKAVRRDIYDFLPLKSYYKNRIDYGDITSQFTIFFEKEFCNFFEIQYEEVKVPDHEACFQKLVNKGLKTDWEAIDSILVDVALESKNIDKGMKIDDNDNSINLKMSPEELGYRYDNLIIKNLGGFAPQRSIPKVKTAILSTFRKYLNMKPANDGITAIQSMIIKNEELFASILIAAVEKYKIFHNEGVEARQSGRFDPDWEIPIDKNYNSETNTKVPSKLSLYEPLYMPIDKNGKIDELEERFIKYLDKHTDAIDWFWKNGDEHMETNFGIQKEDGYTFQPDFLIKFKDGRLGIFDTKALGHNESDHAPKSNALYKYISEERYNGKNIIGGLVVEPIENTFMFYQRPLYKSFKEAPGEWEKFDNLF